MNPWKIIGWIVLGFIVLVLLFCGLGIFGSAWKRGQAKLDDGSTAEPAHNVSVVSLDCSGSPIDSAKVTIINNGPELRFAKVYVEFVDGGGRVAAAEDSFLRPTTIPTGSRASATVYSRATRAGKCRVAEIQDRDGNRIGMR
jgi:hypothetical protein